jgi:cytoskeletal protein RodZ
VTIGTSPSGDSDRSTHAQPTIGQVLGSARLAAELTVDQVSEETRVRVPIIHAVEADDFSRCGGDFYARGHIRSIARSVGADGEALVARYDAAHGGAPSAARPMPLFDERIRSERRRPNWTGAMVAAILVVVAVIGFNLVGGRDKQPAAQAAVLPSPSAPAVIAKPVAPPRSSAVAAAPAGRVTLKVSAETGDTWLLVVNSKGKTLFRNNLSQGASQTFTDLKQLKVVFGDAGAAHLWVNGKDLGKAGTSGQVVNATYTPGDPQAG